MPRPVSSHTVLSAIDPETYYRNDAGLDLKGRPNNQGWLFAVCPLHGDSKPSLSVNLSHGGFCCFGCGEKGDLIRFHSLIHRTSYKAALSDLARRYI